MKTTILCAVSLIAGAAVGSILMAYFMSSLNQRNYAIMVAGDLGSAALQAELIKSGETATVLNTLERTIPLQVLTVHQNEMIRETMVTESAMQAVKRFYVCTQTPIPTEIVTVMEGVALPENVCEPHS